jgi:putative tryptophan/tyrosine transport system substrate-binding protein
LIFVPDTHSGRKKPLMHKKITVLTLCAILLALCSSAQAQQLKKVPLVGVLSGRGAPTPTTPDRNADAFRRGMQDLGYIEGENILLDYRYTEGKPGSISSFVAEFVQLKVDVLVATAPSAILAAKQATKAIPIVMVTTTDPVATGIVDSLARPGGNITGVTRLTRELGGKRLELLTELVPGISRVGVLSVTTSTATGNALEYYEAAARGLKIQLQSLQVRGPNPDLDGAFRDAAKRRVSALITATNRVLLPYTRKIADLAIKNRLPSMYEAGQYVEAGGLISYSANEAESFRRAATYVDKILKGRKPSDLPVEQPTKFELIINLKAAKQIGLTIPPNVLVRADRVIR